MRGLSYHMNSSVIFSFVSVRRLIFSFRILPGTEFLIVRLFVPYRCLLNIVEKVNCGGQSTSKKSIPLAEKVKQTTLNNSHRVVLAIMLTS